MKKTLLIAAAALVAGVISSEAQVYSANIVGYVNFVSVTNSPGFQMICNPLDNGTNTVASLFPNPTPGTQLQVWNGATWGSFSYTKFGFWGTHANDLIQPGVGFFIQVAPGPGR